MVRLYDSAVTTPGDKSELARMLRELMRSKGLTAAELARLSGVNKSIISRVLNEGRGAKRVTLDKLAAALGVDPSTLHRANAVRVGMALEAAQIPDPRLVALIARWEDGSPEAQEAALAAALAVLKELGHSE